MKVGDLVKHWRTKQTGIIIVKKLYTRDYFEWKVVWTDGKWGFYSTDRLVQVKNESR